LTTDEAVITRAPWEWPLRRYPWLEIAWAVFALANLVAMEALPYWETVPFHFIWVSLTIIYGYRVWSAGTTRWVLVAVVVTTGTVLWMQVDRGVRGPDELTEVPLMAAMFLAMVWHAQRRLAAMEGLSHLSEENLRLLQRERQFIQDASHELRTPITIALGHAELLARGSQDPELAEDARIVVDELLRLRRLADRLLLLAASADPDFLSKVPVELGPLLASVRSRWAVADRRWRVENGVSDTVLADPDRLGTAMDALVENAIKRTKPGDEIRLAVRGEADQVAIVVADTGQGMAPDQLGRIFDRFARLDAGRSRDNGGVGLGLPIARAIAEAHGGSIRAQSALGKGSTFEIRLPRVTREPV
jgi:signal transduction histidine kinase